MPDIEGQLAEEWYDRKSALMESMLGKEHDRVMHALIPYAIGGALDLYYFPHGIPGTAIATKELSEVPGEGSSNAAFQCYELVMFTRHPLDLAAAMDESTRFGQAHAKIKSILNRIAPYSTQATLNPTDTLEFPADMKNVGGRCIILDAYPACPDDPPAEFGLLALIEVFRSEMEYARENGGGQLIRRLKAKGRYPYSDLDRESVV